MKKLCIIAAFAGMCGSVFGSACSEVVEPQCYLWDVSFTLKTLGPKKAKCGSCSPCGDTSEVYYLDSNTRKLKGYIWSCEYSCDTWNIVLWDEKNKVALIPLDLDGENQATVSAEDALVYGKKAKKACASFLIADGNGEAIEVMACGMNGKLVTNKGDAYVKSLTGVACGRIAYVKPGTATTYSGGGLCAEPEITLGEVFSAKCLTWCDCCFTSWCDDGEDAPDMVPCEGTWKMKFNKKLASGKKGNIANLVPAYAL